jgi:tetratricopeptide (TPR) repeat protein
MAMARDFEEKLAAAWRQRTVGHGMQLLESAESDLIRLAPGKMAPSLLLLIAQWVDLGFRDQQFLDALLTRMPPGHRRSLRTDDYVRVRLTQGFRDFSAGDLDRAVEAFEFVLAARRDLPLPAEEALAHFWKGRAHRKKGEYETAMQEIVRARELAQKDKNARFTASIQVQESWLLFQKGLAREALQVLNEAESVMKTTDHFVTLGNIESARGRMVRRAGDYASALEHFRRAIEIYGRRDPNHVNVARTLVNAAYVRRLLALKLRKRIERTRAGGELRARYQAISGQAVCDLEKARDLYQRHNHRDGIGNVALNLGFIHLDRGDMERAQPEAEEAHRIGQEKNDRILMARARILQAAIENAHVEEQVGEEMDIAVHANRAREYAAQALALAQATQNRRLLAGAWIAQGISAANDFFQEWETARRCAAEATTLIGPGESDHLVEDLAWLKSRIMQASGINDTLRNWSEGMVGNKTFQQITEEFAEIVIPKVWLREDRKISRVATALSISPKKVRRILRNVGSSAE